MTRSTHNALWAGWFIFCFSFGAVASAIAHRLGLRDWQEFRFVAVMDALVLLPLCVCCGWLFARISRDLKKGGRK